MIKVKSLFDISSDDLDSKWVRPYNFYDANFRSDSPIPLIPHSYSPEIKNLVALSDRQWDLGSGEAYFLGKKSSNDKYNNVSKGVYQFWSAAHDRMGDKYPVSDDVETSYANFTPVPADKETLLDIRLVSSNLVRACLRNDYSYSTGYAYDHGYTKVEISGTKGHHHAGVDIEGKDDDNVYSPINGKVVGFGGKTFWQYVLILEEGGERIWMFMHTDDFQQQIGDEVNVGDHIAELYKTVKTKTEVIHPSHLHISVEETDMEQFSRDVNGEYIMGPSPFSPSYSLLQNGNITIPYKWGKDHPNNEDPINFGYHDSIPKILEHTISPIQAYFESDNWKSTEEDDFCSVMVSYNSKDTIISGNASAQGVAGEVSLANGVTTAWVEAGLSNNTHARSVNYLNNARLTTRSSNDSSDLLEVDAQVRQVIQPRYPDFNYDSDINIATYNNGTQQINKGVYFAILSKDDEADKGDTVIASHSFSGTFNPGQEMNYDLTIDWSDAKSQGDYYLISGFKPENEESFNDNYVAKKITIQDSLVTELYDTDAVVRQVTQPRNVDFNDESTIDITTYSNSFHQINKGRYYVYLSKDDKLDSSSDTLLAEHSFSGVFNSGREMSHSLSVDWSDAASAGDYYLISGFTPEREERHEDNYFAREITISSSSNPVNDLAVVMGRIENKLDNYNVGDEIETSFIVKNLGDIPYDGSSAIANLMIQKDDGSWVEIGATAYIHTWDLDTRIGISDKIPEGVTGEVKTKIFLNYSDDQESNDTFNLPIIEVSTPTPDINDLSVVTGTIDNNSGIYEINDSVEVSFVIKNTGDVAYEGGAAAFLMIQKDDGNWEEIGPTAYIHKSELNTRLSMNGDIPGGVTGEAKVKVFLDFSDDQAQDNNTFEFAPIEVSTYDTTQPYVDIEVLQVTQPKYADINTETTVNVSIYNNGLEKINSTGRFFSILSKDDKADSSDILVNYERYHTSLNPNEGINTDVTFDWSKAKDKVPVGDYYLISGYMPYGEENKSDNYLTKKITLQDSPVNDLSIVMGKIDNNLGDYNTHDSIEASFLIKNMGSISHNATAQLEIQKSNGNWQLIGSKSISKAMIDGEELINISGNIPVGVGEEGKTRISLSHSGDQTTHNNTLELPPIKISNPISSDNNDDDSYFVDDNHDIVTEEVNAGLDTVYVSGLANDYTLADNVENAVMEHLTNTSVTLTGNKLDNHIVAGSSKDIIYGLFGNDIIDTGAGNDVLNGGVGSDLLNGGEGKDQFIGGKGNDNYIVDNIEDSVIEDADNGIDEVTSSVDYTLVANLENLTLADGVSIKGVGNSADNRILGNQSDNDLQGKAGNDNFYGKAGDDTLYGEDGNDLLNGGEGADTLIGGLGDDYYYIDSSDTVTENADEGLDTIIINETYQLVDNIENLKLGGHDTINGTGNDVANTITGNREANILNGCAGNDTLTGGRGADKFLFADDLLQGGIDIITDFKSGEDTIGLAKSIFSTLGDSISASDIGNVLSFDSTSGALSYNATQFATLQGVSDLEASDFYLM